MKVCFETFGCRLNRAEALDEEAAYLAAGWTVTQKHSDADLVVVRGCSVTARAQRDCEKLIDHLHRRYPALTVRVVGCLDRARVTALRAKGRLVAPPPTADVPTRTARAFLKVQDGCAGKCTFCIVPQFRGAPVSVPLADVLAKARRFVEAGYRELVLTGCNLAQYLSGGKRLADLVAALSDALPDARFRLGSVEPGAVAQDLIPVMAERANVCSYLHLAIQSGSDRVLRSMGRPYTRRTVLDNLELAKSLMPTAGIGCDMLVGFPGESESDFLNTVSLVKGASFSRLHVFPYSERPGTLALGLPRPVARETRRRRAHDLTKVGDEKRRAFAKQFLGREVEVIVEDDAKKCGWSGEYLWCECEQPHSVKAAAAGRKSLARFYVTKVRDGHLKGIFV